MANRIKSSSETRLKSFNGQPVKIIGKLSLLATSLLLSNNAFGLGLGALEVSSNLDQPLSGRIQLKVEPSDDLTNLTAVIAPREDFDSLGLEYPEYLKDIGITFDQLGSVPSLVITSNDVIIKEPFINFLVRVEWAGGSFLREYTALIDPPVYAAETPQSIVEPQTVGTDQTFGGDVAVDNEPEVSDIVESDSAAVADTPDQQEVESTITPSSDAQYGPVLQGESLSLIAQELQGQFPELSIYQIMKVLFEENPDAFIDSNINGLIKGSLLRVGDLQAIRAVDIEDGRGFFREQLLAWDSSAFSDSSSSSDPISVGGDSYNPDADFNSDPNTTSDAVTEVEDSFQVGSSAEDSDIVSADQDGNREGEVLALRDQINSLEASLASSSLENEELTERIRILEGQLGDMDRLLELGVENADLAQLESTLAAQNEELADVDDSIDEFSTDVATDDLDDILADVSDGIDGSIAEADSSIDEFLNDDAPISGLDGSLDESLTDVIDDNTFGETLEDGVEDFTGSVDDSIGSVDDSIGSVEDSIDQAEEVANIADTPPVSARPAQAEESSGLWKIIAGVGALLVAALALLFYRRRRADEEFEVSMLSIESNSQTTAASGQMSSTASLSATQTQSTSVASVADNADKETSFLTVYSDSDAVVQADEVDPVAEADVYIAYGRDEQAEEVLLDGVTAQPDRADIKHKLLTLYHKSSNVEGFERIAEELYSSGTATNEMWQEVATMGQEVSPSNPLFNLSVSDAEHMSPDAASDNNEALTSADAERDVDNLVTVSEVESDVQDQSADQIVEALSEDASIQLTSLDDGDLTDVELDENELLDAVGSDANDSNVVQLLADDDASSANLDTDDALEFDVKPKNKFSEYQTEDEDGERSIREVQEVSDLEIDEDYDESRTQYELAKVFVDLGDEDGAKRILNELVANDDNDAEVLSDARELLKSIS